MSRLVLISAWLLAIGTTFAPGGDEFSTAAVAEILRTAPHISVSQVQLLGTPAPTEKFQRVAIRSSYFDPSLEQWQLQLECVPTSACVPSVAIVRSSNKNLFSRDSQTGRKPPLLQIRPGDRRQLLTAIGAIRFRVSVVCLQPGRAGDQIRVREVDGKHVFLANVQPDGTLQARRTP